MKIAAVTDDNETISQHFGRAMKYSVLLIDEGQVVDRELREKANHQDFQRDGLEGQHQHQDDPSGIIGVFTGMAEYEKEAQLYTQGINIGEKVFVLQTERGDVEKAIETLNQIGCLGVWMLPQLKESI